MKSGIARKVVRFHTANEIQEQRLKRIPEIEYDNWQDCRNQDGPDKGNSKKHRVLRKTATTNNRIIDKASPPSEWVAVGHDRIPDVDTPCCKRWKINVRDMPTGMDA